MQRPVSGPSQAKPPARTSVRGLLAQTEIDLRLFGMLIALAAILVAFHVWSGGTLIRPVNMITMAVQACGIAIIATGMVLVIVSRNIDLSVGSLVGFIAMSYALLMTDWFPRVLGIPAGAPYQWILALAIGIAIGAAFGALQGFIIAYVGVPSFIVTLGGLFSIRGLVWYPVAGRGRQRHGPHVRPDWRRRARLGGRDLYVADRLSVGCLVVGFILYNSRRQRRRYGFPTRPMWAEVLIGVAGCVASLGLAWFANQASGPGASPTGTPPEHGITPPPGGTADPDRPPVPDPPARLASPWS